MDAIPNELVTTYMETRTFFQFVYGTKGSVILYNIAALVSV